MRITATEEVGLRCMLQLALHHGQTVSLAELAAEEGIAPPFAAKVLLSLRRAGLVEAVRGRRGGYALAAPPARITVMDVLSAVGKPLYDKNFCREHGSGGEGSCRRVTECSLRPVWAHVDALLRQFFNQTTIADLASSERSMRDRLSERWPLQVPAPRSGMAGVGLA